MRNIGNVTLVIMAAGIGSRFGGGIKQLEPVGPNGELIIDYSIYDALEAGFNKVVFVIRKDLEKDFKEIIGSRIEEKVKVEYVYQEVKDIPEKYRQKFQNRQKPWGTGQAILCCKKVVKEPFLVINADDFYGKMAYKKAYDYLVDKNEEILPDKLTICMIGFILENTLSENGGVTRGVCRVNEDNMLQDIAETSNIVKSSEGVSVQTGKAEVVIDPATVVSMNMWGFVPEFFKVLEMGFDRFLLTANEKDTETEYLLPTIVGKLLDRQQVEVSVLKSEDKWFGVTYKKDKESVVKSLKNLVTAGLYENK